MLAAVAVLRCRSGDAELIADNLENGDPGLRHAQQPWTPLSLMSRLRCHLSGVTMSWNQTLAEVCRAYANFSVPPFSGAAADQSRSTTLVEQAEGLSVLQVAEDNEPAETRWRSTLPFLDEVVRLYGEGWTVNQISAKVGIHWNSAAKLLDRAGVRQRRRPIC